MEVFDMYDKRMQGVVIAAITPMNPDGSVDYEGVEAFAEYLSQSGVNCLYPNGTNGESLLLTKEEREKIAEIFVKTSRGRVPVFIQCGAMTTEETASHAQHAVKIGADGIGIMTPAFFTMDDEGLFQYFSAAIAPLPEDFPVYIYNIPGCTGNDVSPALLARLLKTFPNVRGIKFSKPDLMRLQDYMLACERKPDLLIGCDSLALCCMDLGGAGWVSGPGAVFADCFVRMYREIQEGDWAAAKKTQKQIADLGKAMAGIPEIPAIKYMLCKLGVIRYDVCRAPLRKLTDEEKARLDKLLEDYLTAEKG
jgi:4-hydroxy-tetrahydrodipicolinate synthase